MHIWYTIHSSHAKFFPCGFPNKHKGITILYFFNRRTHKRIDVRALEVFAVETYRECPKQVTIVVKATNEADSGFHCIPMSSGEDLSQTRVNRQLRKFIVPGQGVIMARDRMYGLFSITRVAEQMDGPNYWLVTSVKNYMGFLLPFEKLPPELIESEGT